MARKPASNQKSLAKIDGFEKFDRVFRGIASVPKEEVEAKERKHAKKKARHNARRKR